MTATRSLFEDLLAAIETGKAPLPARRAAARGALPLDLVELTSVQVLLTRDAEEEVRSAADASLAALGPEEARSLASAESVHPAVLTWLATDQTHRGRVGTLIARHPRADSAALLELAASAEADVLAALVGNEVALLASEALRRRLLDNPALPNNARLRLLDYVEEVAKAQKADEADASGLDETCEPEQEAGASWPDSGLTPAKDPQLAALGIDAEVEALLPELDLGLDAAVLFERSELLGEGDDDEVDSNTLRRLSKLNVGQKLRVALFGSKEERRILIGDSNRLVCTAVIKNPKFTEAEAENVSFSRNVNPELLRLVARHKKFGKSYSIQHNLIRNPRCPPEIALGKVALLKDKDLKMLAKNRNVSDAVRRHARKMMEVREARKRVRLRPGK